MELHYVSFRTMELNLRIQWYKIYEKKKNINKKYSSPYRPQTNGLVERTNRTIIGILSKIAFFNLDNWDKFLPLARFNYNIRFIESIGCSPFELLFGRKPYLAYEKKN